MATSGVDATTMLVVDVGTVTTQATFFDVVDGRYRFIASGKAPTTAGVPFRDISEGVRRAIDHLQSLTGRTFLGQDERIILPTTADGRGVDAFAATLSAGPDLKVVAVGLLEDVSLESVRRLAASTYTGALETISLNDRRRAEARMDAIVRLRPDLILVAGGTESGASQSVMKLVEAIGLACYVLPQDQKPELLFAGNVALQEEVKASLEKFAHVHLAPNIRPALEVEQLDAAQVELAQLVKQVRLRQVPGARELDEWSQGQLLPSAAALGRLVRFLSKAHASAKGVLGVDLGASVLTLAAAFNGELSLGVYPQLGLASTLAYPRQGVSTADVLRWVTHSATEEVVRDVLANKALYPASIPVTVEEWAIEQAYVRAALQAGMQRVRVGFPLGTFTNGRDLLPSFEPILVSGSALTRASSLSETLLMILDGLQPVGATTVVLDQNHLAAGLGAAATQNPTLAVQILDSNAFLHLGTVISPVVAARPGTPILRIKMMQEGGQESTLEVKQGTLEVLPLAAGKTARLQIHALHRANVGMGGPGRGGGIRVVGGALGVVIDARGRPLRLPDDLGKRQEAYKRWTDALGR